MGRLRNIGDRLLDGLLFPLRAWREARDSGRRQHDRERLNAAMVDIQWYQPPIAGRFSDGRWQRHPWLRVLGAGRHDETGEKYYNVQIAFSGASWWKASEIDLYPDEPSP
jgi:hypothetical protein